MTGHNIEDRRKRKSDVKNVELGMDPELIYYEKMRSALPFLYNINILLLFLFTFTVSIYCSYLLFTTCYFTMNVYYLLLLAGLFCFMSSTSMVLVGTCW